MTTCRLVLAGLLSLLVPGCSTSDSSSDERRAQGVVVYLVDTLRADHLGCYGYERDTSPAIDAFAREGVVFERCMSQSSWTKPATASVLTGLYAAHHGANKEPLPIRDDVDTLAEVLSAAGVRTGAFFTSAWIGKKHGFQQGFDVHQYVERSEEQRSQAALDAALAFIDEARDEPFFVFVHVTDPHAPYAPPPPYDTRFDHGYTGTVSGSFGLSAEPGSFADLTEADLQHLVDLYDGEIAFSDDLFKGFLEGLKSLGRYEQTAIFFLADHGEEFGEHGRMRHNPYLFDEVVRIPLIARFPGLPAPLVGSRVERLSMQVDVMPTVLGLLGVEEPAGLPGVDLVDDMVRRASDPRFAIIEVDSSGTYRKAVVSNGLKYVRAWAPTQSESLYDFDRDPTESEDLIDVSPERALGHRLLMEDFLVETNRGFFLLVQNGGEETLRVECLVFADVGHPEVTPLFTEGMPGLGAARDREPQQDDIEQADGSLRKGTRLVLLVEPGDGDGLRLVPAEGETGFEFHVNIDKVSAEPRFVLLGPNERNPEAVPFRVAVASGPELAAAMYAPREKLDGDPYRVRLWSGTTDSTGATIEFSQEEIQALQAIGYMGDE